MVYVAMAPGGAERLALCSPGVESEGHGLPPRPRALLCRPVNAPAALVSAALRAGYSHRRRPGGGSGPCAVGRSRDGSDACLSGAPWNGS